MPRVVSGYRAVAGLALRGGAITYVSMFAEAQEVVAREEAYY